MMAEVRIFIKNQRGPRCFQMQQDRAQKNYCMKLKSSNVVKNDGVSKSILGKCFTLETISGTCHDFY